MAPGHVAAVCLLQLRAIELAAAIAGHECVSRPRLWTERGPALFQGIIETEAAGRLMLRSIVEGTRLVDDVGQILWMPWWESIVSAHLNVQQFIKRVSVGQPGGPFLIGAEEIAGLIELETDREADAGGKDFSRLQVGGQRARWCRVRS